MNTSSNGSKWQEAKCNKKTSLHSSTTRSCPISALGEVFGDRSTDKLDSETRILSPVLRECCEEAIPTPDNALRQTPRLSPHTLGTPKPRPRPCTDIDADV